MATTESFYNTIRDELDGIRRAGLYKSERIITTQQGSRIDTTDKSGVINLCANNYLGLSAHPAVLEAASQALADRVKIASGSLVIGGQDAAGWTPARRARSIAYLPQNMRRVLFNMTLLQEVTFAITASTSIPKDPTVIDRAKAYLAKYGLNAFEETNPFALSSRQQALLGLACADAAGSPIAILDEPLLARDLQGRRMLDLFLDDAALAGRAVMLISHDLELVAEATSRVLVLDQGCIAFDGPTDEAWQSKSYEMLQWPKPSFELNAEASHALS